MLSIITPFFNSSDKILKLLDCLKNQTNKNFELIIVDDHSENYEVMKLKDYLKDVSFSVKIKINNKNYGPGIARSNGIKEAIGDYIVFVDSDDTVSCEFVQMIQSSFRNSNADIVCFDYAILKGYNKISCKKIEKLDKCTVSKEELIIYGKSCICGSAFNRSFIMINQIEFPELYRYEDWVFNIRAALKSKKIYYLHKELYYYIVESESLVNSGKYDAGEYALKAFNMIEKELALLEGNICDILYEREVVYVNAVSKVLRLSYNEYKSFLKKIKANEHYCNSKYVSYMSLHQRFIMKLVKYNMYFVLNLMIKIVNLM